MNKREIAAFEKLLAKKQAEEKEIEQYKKWMRAHKDIVMEEVQKWTKPSTPVRTMTISGATNEL